MIHVSSKLMHETTGATPASNHAIIYVMPVRSPSIPEGREIDADLQELLDSISKGLGCVRAVQVAVAIEAAGALLVYAVWLLAHLGR